MPSKKKTKCGGCGKSFVNLDKHKCKADGYASSSRESPPPPPVTKVLVPGTELELLPALEAFLVPIQDVTPDPANPRRTKSLEGLKVNFKRFGIRRPIIVNKGDGIIEAGHQTRATLLEMGATHIPVIYADDDRIDAVAFNIADNRSNEITAEWDEAPLARLLKELKAVDAVDDLGFELSQIDSLISSFADSIDEQNDPPLPPPPDGGTGGESLTGRILIVYEDEEQKKQLESLLGTEIGTQITWSISDIMDLRGD